MTRFRSSGDGRTLGLVGVLLVVQALLVAAFVLPAHKPEPHGVPVGAVGPPALAQGIEAGDPGAFDVHTYDSAPAARNAIAEREVYGAAIAGTDGKSVLVASAASPTVAGMIRAAAQHAGIDDVVEVAPLAVGDPRGSTLNLIFLPLIMACSGAVLLLSRLRLSAPRLLAALALFAALGGAAVTLFVGSVLDALPGSFTERSGVLALITLAIAVPTAGLERLLGQAGAALAGVFFVLIGNPASGNASAPELLPGVWRAIGQWMPPGAGGTALRNTAYFDGNATLRPLLVLGLYAVVGAALVVVASIARRRHAADGPTELPSVELKRAA